MPVQGSITILVDNSTTGPGLVAEHGLAAWLDLGTRHLLFDTGQTDAIVFNARHLGVDLSTVDVIALSHGHYDHSGGLADVLRMAPGASIYIHPSAIQPKYRQSSTGVRPIGMPAGCVELLRGAAANVHTVTGPTEITPGVFLTGEIPRRHPMEQNEEGFLRDSEGLMADPLLDDQSLFVRTPAGTIVLLGCAHAGVVNTLDYVRHLTDGRPIHTVLGGMHLRSASDERIAWTIDALRQLSIERLYPTHCTGTKAIAALDLAFPGRCRLCGVGTVVPI